MLPSEIVSELNFDGLVGPTHQYAGLSPGNLASELSAGQVGNPRRAALEGLAKMRFVAGLGVRQAVLPPLPRPDVGALRQLGFHGSDADVLRAASADDAYLLRLCSSASSMWAANAATVVPSADTEDGRVHVTIANLSSLFHRSLEASGTHAVLRAIFADPVRFAVHPPLPPGPAFSDEGAANHVRLATSAGKVHLFAWGRSASDDPSALARYPRRQTREASEAVARLSRLPQAEVVCWQQDPVGIDGGAFHTDVLAVGNDAFLMLHEHAFVHHRDLIAQLERRLGPTFRHVLAKDAELSVGDAVAAYPFNSQILTLPGGSMAIVAPTESREEPAARALLERVVAEDNPVTAVHYVEVNASMRNGGGPACLRLRAPLTGAEQAALGGRVVLDDALATDLEGWVDRHYRDRMTVADLADPLLLVEVRAALDELSQLLALGSIYDFQRP